MRLGEGGGAGGGRNLKKKKKKKKKNTHLSEQFWAAPQILRNLARISGNRIMSPEASMVTKDISIFAVKWAI